MSVANCKKYTYKFVKRVLENGSVLDKITHVRSRPVCSMENIGAVAQYVPRHPSTSTRHRFQESMYLSSV